MKIATLLASALALGSFSGICDARVWSKDPIALAQDYLVVQDHRSAGDLVIVFWLASPLIPANSPNVVSARAILDKYTLVAAAHVKFSAEGTLSPIDEQPATASDASGRALTKMDNGNIPPAMVGTLAVLQSVFSKTLGPFGQTMHWSVFTDAPAKACEKGGLRVAFAGTSYTFDTPVPGCS